MNDNSWKHERDDLVHGSQVDGVPLEELERELPTVHDGQIPLSELLSRVVQGIYAELTEMAETLPSMSDAVRKRTLADWVVKTKKQVVKLYAVAKWSRDAETVQKCMNITAFLMNQNFQFDAVTQALIAGKQNLDQARLRNHDLLTSLDVLTTGSYLRLPTCIKKRMTPQSPLTDEEVTKTLKDMEDVILYRLRMSEVIPVEMSRYRIADGRVFFTVPKLFEASLCLQGPAADAGWFFVHVEFPININGDLASIQEFPKAPTGITKRFITDEADFRLAYYLLPDPETPDARKLPNGVVDTPLVRLYNFLQMMSLSYQLEILWFQAERMRSLGWRDCLSVQMSPDRKTMTIQYWTRPLMPHQPGQPRGKQKPPPLFGGTLTIAIESIMMRKARTPEQIMLARIQQQVKLGNAKPSDEVEPLKLFAKWTPSQGVLALNVPLSELSLPRSDLEIDCENLDFESMLRKFGVFGGGSGGCRRRCLYTSISAWTRLLTNQVLDPRTGRMNLRDINSFAIAGRAPRFYYTALAVNQWPEGMIDSLSQLRNRVSEACHTAIYHQLIVALAYLMKTIIELAEEKARYLGYLSYRTRNFRQQDLDQHLGRNKGLLYIQLKRFPDHYLVLVVKAKGFSYALMTTSTAADNPLSPMVIGDIAFLNFERIKAGRLTSEASSVPSPQSLGVFNLRSDFDLGDSIGFDLTIQTLKELYSYCCARVAYINVERQLKARDLSFTYVSPASGVTLPPELSRIQSSLARSVPALCVQATQILAGAPAAEAAMPNVRVIPLNWWSEESAQVVTCVKLKYVQQPLGKRAGSIIIRPSKRIVYDTTEAVVSFLSENINTCVDEFLEEWAKVSKMVVIAREVAKMSKEKGWKDMQLLSFDLQTVEFAYAEGYSVSVTCEDQLSSSGAKFDLRFTRTCPSSPESERGSTRDTNTFNPHDDAEPFLSNILRHGQGRLAPSLERLVMMLRDTLPIVVELEKIRRACEDENYHVDTYAKSSGWYRILYPSLRHAVDFRLMTGQRVAILDASHSLFKPSSVRIDGASKPQKDSSASSASQSQPSSTTASATGMPASTSTSTSSTSLSSPLDKVLLQPIPDFATITKQVVGEAGSPSKNLVDLNHGLICDTTVVGALMQVVHSKVVERLKGIEKR
ncbi:hypothetical protein NMY22_g10058 [Coprinellus aureogranulatus]|nr:hypothetical protein NMY22_g10058 [Coprinellus aureogranulatus]